ncbi:MarR family transcriptional regulator [Ectobacillus sp. sgz5001026]|uniref:MarR family transcriptional regulator n=1 Tax=Ectobacillus sp. sgz5001026 TaxID=3242473 RepID=UPI0036D3FABD
MKDGMSDYMSHSGMSESDKRLWQLYMQVIHAAGVGDVDAWVQLDVSMTQMKVLMLLNAHGQMSVSSLAEHMKASLSNMTGIIDRLEGLGFAQRVHGTNDRRSVLVSLTSKASTLFQNLTQSGHEKLQRAMSYMNEEERSKVEEGLEILTRSLHQAGK